MPYAWSPVSKSQVADDVAINALGAAVTSHDAVLAALAAPWTSYVPTWTNTGTANTPGGAIFTGNYRRIGKTVDVRIFLQWDAATVAGSLIWRFSLPFAPLTTGEILLAMARDQSAGTLFPCVARLSSSVDVVDIGAPSGAAISGGTVPFTWANGDQLTIQGTYETSA